MLPVAFENDDGQKEAWRKALRERLMELGEQEESGSLRGGDAQNPAYRASLEGYTHKPVSILPPESGGGGGGAAASDGAADAGASDAFDQGAAAQRELEALRGRGLGGIQAENQQLKGAAAPPWAGQAKPKPKKKPALPARDRGGGGGRGGEDHRRHRVRRRRWPTSRIGAGEEVAREGGPEATAAGRTSWQRSQGGVSIELNGTFTL